MAARSTDMSTLFNGLAEPQLLAKHRRTSLSNASSLPPLIIIIMVLRYLESLRMGRGHTSGVSALAFSPRGTYLASVALDGKVCVWNPSDGGLLHVFHSAVPILSLTWTAPSEDTVICGLQDGTVVSLVITEVR